MIMKKIEWKEHFFKRFGKKNTLKWAYSDIICPCVYLNKSCIRKKCVKYQATPYYAHATKQINAYTTSSITKNLSKTHGTDKCTA